MIEAIEKANIRQCFVYEIDRGEIHFMLITTRVFQRLDRKASVSNFLIVQ